MLVCRKSFLWQWKVCSHPPCLSPVAALMPQEHDSKRNAWGSESIAAGWPAAGWGWGKLLEETFPATGGVGRTMRRRGCEALPAAGQPCAKECRSLQCYLCPPVILWRRLLLLAVGFYTRCFFQLSLRDLTVTAKQGDCFLQPSWLTSTHPVQGSSLGQTRSVLVPL